MLRPYTGLDPAQFDHMRTDLDAELFQQQLADRAARHPGHRLAGARPLQDVARVLAVVFERAREIGVPRGGGRPPAAPPRPPGGRPPGPEPPPRAPPPGPPPPPRPAAPPPPPRPRPGARQPRRRQ